MQDFRKLTVWQSSMELARRCYAATTSFPRGEQFGLTDQIRRSAVSVPSNIAEGSGRGTKKEFVRFMRIAYGSACELGTQLELSRRLGLGDPDNLADLLKSVEDTRRMLSVLIDRVASNETTT
jgi:four helix bundle protein